MSYADAQFYLGSFFGMYIAGWCAAYTIHAIKIFMEKI